jgi:hypothetical protein
MRSYSTLGDMSEIHQEAERVTSGVQVIVDLSAMLRGQLETLLVNRFQEPAAHFLVYLEASPDDAVAFLFINDLGHLTSALRLFFAVVSRSPRIEFMGSNHEAHEKNRIEKEGHTKIGQREGRRNSKSRSAVSRTSTCTCQ